MKKSYSTMQGTILAYSKAVGMGVITTPHGDRFIFRGTDWGTPGIEPLADMPVLFKATGRVAYGIQLL